MEEEVCVFEGSQERVMEGVNMIRYPVNKYENIIEKMIAPNKSKTINKKQDVISHD